MQTSYFPLFSIIIPNFNREEVIRTAISSVLEQTYTNFEIIVVDDCSTDNSRQVIAGVKDARLKLLQMPKNSGAAAARNYGIKHSKGDYISLLDSDDFYAPEFLEETFKGLSTAESSVGFSWTGVRYFEAGKSSENIWQPLRKENAYITFLHSLHIGTNSGITFKKEIFERVGYFNEALPAAEDTDFFLRLTQQFEYEIIPKILINIEKDNEDRLSKNFKKVAMAYNIFLDQHFPVIEKNIKLKQRFYYKLMWLNYHLAHKDVARNYFKKIPKSNFKILFKVFITFGLYEIFSLEKAKDFHRKFSRY
ncbi:glycosyltransferase family 2 protein [Salinimicrobium sp. WS361]|uniref:glycosyltransferase family 2 protein n=1 Tax=Salinimicrobium sp. WS361 TaxID=3425123 RepID=UPI003D700886